MTAAENLFEMARNWWTPDSVRKFSLELDEPTEKVEAGLQSVVPTLLDGIINEGSTSEGAQKIVNLMEAENLDGTIPDIIFGNDYHTIASRLTPSTGLEKEDVEKLMAMAAPGVLEVIASKIKDDLNAESLNDFLLKQKAPETFEEKKKAPFSLIVAGFVLIILGSLWFLSRETLPVTNLKREIATIENQYTPATAGVSRNGLTLQDISSFMATATLEDLPKRFNMRSLSFYSGTTDMRPGGDKEIELMVRTLKRYPKLRASIEAFIEDTGDEDENLLLSENRAMLVREEIIGRGVEPSRVRAEGRGPKTSGQLYFVIHKM